MAYNKFKECLPEETIARYKKILKDLGSVPEETFYEVTPGVWCGWLYDPEHHWSTNGKGTTKEYCMASAYGEAMERLQNMFFTSPWQEASEEAQVYKDFYKYPDESTMSVLDAITLNPHLYEDLQLLFFISENRYPLNDFELASSWIAQLKNTQCECLPFYSCRDQKVTLMPMGILAAVTGTNGESSGNTPEEALCQGLSELFERYAEKMVYFQKLTPPEISRGFLAKNYPDQFQTIQNIENLHEGYKLRVMDFSLGRNLPVIGVLLIDTQLQRYRLQLGAHPLFGIALERCLTELLQGYTPGIPEHDTLFLTPWTQETSANAWSSKNNDMRFTNGIGSIPNEMLYAKPSWEFRPWINQENFSNKKGMDFLISLALTIAPDVYIRDNSILGVSSFSIYIPVISLSYYALGWHQLVLDPAFQLLRNTDDFNVFQITKEEKELMLDYYQNNPTQDMMYPKGLPTAIVQAALLCDANRFTEAYALLKDVPWYEESFKAAAKDLELLLAGVSEADRNNLLEVFFGSEALMEVQRVWRKSPYVLENLYTNTARAKGDPVLNSQVPERALAVESAQNRTAYISDFLIAIKDYMSNYPVHQENIKNILA